MKQYQDLLQTILDTGIRQSNRTGTDTLTVPGAMLKFDLRDGFPAVTTKKLAFNNVKGELIGFLRGCTTDEEFVKLGCNVWTENAFSPAWVNSPHHNGTPGDLGRIYGVQWREWRGVSNIVSTHGYVTSIDQIAVALETLRNNPHSRRIIVQAWNPAEVARAALPPCHTSFQLLPHVDSKVLHMTFQMRSWDMFPGAPFNIASYAILLELFAAWAGYTPGTLTAFGSDCHIYVDHIDQVKEQLSRSILPAPTLHIEHPLMVSDRSLDFLLDKLNPADIWLDGYQSHAAIKAPMAV